MTATRAYLSLGSNVGDRIHHLRTAIDHLRAEETLLAVSAFYETEPVEFTDQPWFLNCALAIETSKTAHQLLHALLALELQMGRKRVQKKGPRSIDLDILLFGNEIVHEAGLTIPHPALAERRFVLEPLAEVAPEVVHPVLQKTIRQLRDALPEGPAVRKITVRR